MKKLNKKETIKKAKESLKKVRNAIKKMTDVDFIEIKLYSPTEMEQLQSVKFINKVDYEDGIASGIKYGSNVIVKQTGIERILTDKNGMEYIPSVDIKAVVKFHPAMEIKLRDEYHLPNIVAFLLYDGSIIIKEEIINPEDSLKLAKLIMKKHGYKIYG